MTGKTASCAAMALTFADYAVAGPWWAQRLVAVAGVFGLAALNYRGVTKTAMVTRILVAATLVALTVIVVGIAVGGAASAATSAGSRHWVMAGFTACCRPPGCCSSPLPATPASPPWAKRSAIPSGRFPGPFRWPWPSPWWSTSSSAPPPCSPPAPTGSPLPRPRWPTPSVPLVAAVAPVVRVGAALASLGALLALITGVGRTSLAMARNRDLPGWLATVHPRFRVPHRAEATLAVVVSILVLTSDLREVIGFSSFGVLVYYGIANVCALTQPADQRRRPRALNIVGVAGCAALVATLPITSVVAGLVMFAAGLAGRRYLQHRVTSGALSGLGRRS